MTPFSLTFDAYHRHVDSRTEAREFLQSRRARLSPADSPHLRTANRRRVPGLRREEVAQIAGVSIDYYTRLEKGRLETASPAVLGAIARALQLNEAERSHLFSLAQAIRGEAEKHVGCSAEVRQSIVWMLDSMTMCPAYVRNGRLDVLAVNALGRALYSPFFESRSDDLNLAKFCFLDPAAQSLFPEWPVVARGTVALLRADLGRNPSDPDTGALIDLLVDSSSEFQSLWATHDVSRTVGEIKIFDHPVVGTMTLALEVMELPADPGLTLIGYAAERGSTSEERLLQLASVDI
jgi:transcriptional regulator with XRE-family HTH domain